MCSDPFLYQILRLLIHCIECKLIGEIYVINNDSYLTFDALFGVYINTMKTNFYLSFDFLKAFLKLQVSI